MKHSVCVYEVNLEVLSPASQADPCYRGPPPCSWSAGKKRCFWGNSGGFSFLTLPGPVEAAGTVLLAVP